MGVGVSVGEVWGVGDLLGVGVLVGAAGAEVLVGELGVDVALVDPVGVGVDVVDDDVGDGVSVCAREIAGVLRISARTIKNENRYKTVLFTLDWYYNRLSCTLSNFRGNSLTISQPAAKPPICAHQATPPTDAAPRLPTPEKS